MTALAVAEGVVLRPMAQGTLALAGDRPPVVLDALHERILAVCARATARDELVEVLVELGEFGAPEVTGALAELVEQGLLHAA